MVNAEQLQKLHIGLEWLEPINETFTRFGIVSTRQQAAFLGQCMHESNHFKSLTEGLSYSAERLMKVWPKRFPTLESAQPYARNGKALANKVYANRMGNRDEASGDGGRFCGRGCIQLTGATSYYQAGKALGVDLWANPELVATPKYAMLTAGWFWATHKCNEVAEDGDWTKLTKIINGGTVGLDDRIRHINEVFAVLSA